MVYNFTSKCKRIIYVDLITEKGGIQLTELLSLSALPAKAAGV